MRRWLLTLLSTAALSAGFGLWGAPLAWAQFGGGGMRPMGPGQGGGPQGNPAEQKQEEQQAEAAPETPGQEPALQPLPAWPGQREKQLQFLQIDGYLRGRAYLFSKLNLGVPFTGQGVVPPFFVPYSESMAPGSNPAATCSARNNNNGCVNNNLTSADMRMRLEPTINVTEQVRVKMQADIFDNLVLGSTPEGFFLNGLGPSRDVPLQSFARSQVPPTAGVNSFTNSIVVKRAWAEVRTPIGELRFGRMPSQWGMGMLVNSGDCLDCDFGVNVDRVMFATKFKEHFLALIWDWVATGPTTALYTPNQVGGQAFNAEPLNNVSQWGLAIGRNDKPEVVKERVERGELSVNYGGYFIFRWQDWDLKTNPGFGQPRGALTGVSPNDLSALLTPRQAWAFIPDLWFRLVYKKFQIEAEGAIIGGRIANAVDLDKNLTKPITILEWGGTVRAEYRLLHDALHIGAEIGYASGDQGEDPNAIINYRTAQIVRPVTQTTISNFQFDPDYHVDLILFRRIIGTVTNATYFKPSVAYDIIDSLAARVELIYSLANKPVAYPGNAVNLGVEIDASVMYHNDAEGFYAGLAYGVLFPLDALNIPETIYPGQGHNAETAQTFQGRMVVKF
jgi:uncharacterized protein (TIGR04551 family)